MRPCHFIVSLTLSNVVGLALRIGGKTLFKTKRFCCVTTNIMSDERSKHALYEGIPLLGEKARTVWPLYIAAEDGDLRSVEDLVRGGADVNCSDGMGRTPLVAACDGNHPDVAKYLLDKGATKVPVLSIRHNYPYRGDDRNCSLPTLAARRGFSPLLKVRIRPACLTSYCLP